MELINHTPYRAHVTRTPIGERHELAVVVVKATFNVDRHGYVTLERERSLPIYREYLMTEAGQLWPEDFSGCFKPEVFVLGKAMTRGLEPAPMLDVSLRVGNHAVTARIFGRRRWRKRWIRGFQISEPEPFSTMPLDWAHAFGGRAITGGRKVPNLDNPLGRGYVLDEQAVDGVELPNIEEPERRIQHWTDTPRPLAFSPLPPGSALVDIDDQHNPTPPESSMSGPWATGSSTLNFAHPLLRLEHLSEGVVVEMQGMHHSGRHGFVLALPQVFAIAELGRSRTRLYCKPDTLYLYPQHDRYAVVARKAIRYEVREGESRAIVLDWPGEP